MPTLWVKAKQEMLPGSLLISFEFPIVGVEPDCHICPKTGQKDGNKNKPNVYVWRL